MFLKKSVLKPAWHEIAQLLSSIDVLPLVHGIVDHGVDTAVGHGQPVEGQEHVRGVPGLHDGGVVEGVHEVGVVGQPAHSKYQCYCSKHFHNLK